MTGEGGGPRIRPHFNNKKPAVVGATLKPVVGSPSAGFVSATGGRDAQAGDGRHGVQRPGCAPDAIPARVRIIPVDRDAIDATIRTQVSRHDLQRPVQALETPAVGKQRPGGTGPRSPRSDLFACSATGSSYGMPHHHDHLPGPPQGVAREVRRGAGRVKMFGAGIIPSCFRWCVNAESARPTRLFDAISPTTAHAKPMSASLIPRSSATCTAWWSNASDAWATHTNACTRQSRRVAERRDAEEQRRRPQPLRPPFRFADQASWCARCASNHTPNAGTTTRSAQKRQACALQSASLDGGGGGGGAPRRKKPDLRGAAVATSSAARGQGAPRRANPAP